MCALLAGDSRATAKEAETVGQFDASVLLRCLPDSTGVVDAIDESGSCVAANNDEDTPSDTGDQHTTPVKLSVPPSAGKRTERIKRYQDGRLKNKAATAKDDTKESVASFMRTAQAYFQLKMKLLEREIVTQATHDV
ncbi:hypothetical protein PF010_g15280 [Phytophthora fragariae]|uniref:Uncharacterized protein n=1 Tax=Phytophthora fragariae TaxID=53985 RepID=A0A6A3ZSK8_9STRA|nr:hypothetical protein PF009_g17741 [Phytophthora fragariae]KAE9000644.1 hypothetical protein PF011_g14090 [Phytophthora fragariae]KAE9099209.1 hypothetical protein PF010_g15280 [Phytophthora fragariae]KAE9133139.1 hypothetical protein PF006_g15102 [Phytophthora fragariae]KAE9212401.1 hypothetical protein PF004_g15636 [Phytophthora fragariae]